MSVFEKYHEQIHAEGVAPYLRYGLCPYLIRTRYVLYPYEARNISVRSTGMIRIEFVHIRKYP